MSSQSEATNNNVAPLYITIGPMCAGKTTYLSNLPEEVVDISIDGQPGVYYPLPCKFLLSPEIDRARSKPSTYRTRQRIQQIQELEEKVYNLTLLERISCPTQMEMRILFKYLTQDLNESKEGGLKTLLISLEQELKDIAKLHSRPRSNIPQWKLTYPNDLLQDFIDAFALVKQLSLSSSPDKHVEFSSPNKTVDLFIFEALFNPPYSAVETAISFLDPPPHKPQPSLQNRNFSHVPIAWGNTNTKVGDYEAALRSAEKYGRPVHFIVFDVFGENYFHNDSRGNVITLCEKLRRIKWELPHVSRLELIKRNIERFLATGRYINMKTIDDAIRRCKDLLCSAQDEIKSSQYTEKEIADDKFALDKALSKLAGYQMGADRKVVKIDHANITLKKQRH